MPKNNNPRKLARNKMQDFVDTVQDDLEELDNEEFLVITNPKNKRIKHVIDREEGIEMPPRRGVSTGMESLCSHYSASGTSLFSLMRDYDEVSGVMEWSEILDDHAMCKNCKDKI